MHTIPHAHRSLNPQVRSSCSRWVYLARGSIGGREGQTGGVLPGKRWPAVGAQQMLAKGRPDGTHSSQRRRVKNSTLGQLLNYDNIKIHPIRAQPSTFLPCTCKWETSTCLMVWRRLREFIPEAIYMLMAPKSLPPTQISVRTLLAACGCYTGTSDSSQI